MFSFGESPPDCCLVAVPDRHSSNRSLSFVSILNKKPKGKALRGASILFPSTFPFHTQIQILEIWLPAPFDSIWRTVCVWSFRASDAQPEISTDVIGQSFVQKVHVLEQTTNQNEVDSVNRCSTDVIGQNFVQQVYITGTNNQPKRSWFCLASASLYSRLGNELFP